WPGGHALTRNPGNRTDRRRSSRSKGRIMTPTHEPVAVLGIGTMGHGMAISALRAGIPTIVWNREPEATRDLAELGADVAESVAPLFDGLGQRTIWVGAVGAGSGVKLVNNTWLAFAAEGVAASVALARRLGLETGTLVDVLGGGPLMSPWQVAKLQRIAKGDFSAQFALSLALKDVHLALQAADNRLAALACLAEEWQQVVDHGLGDQDLTVVTQALEQEEGMP